MTVAELAAKAILEVEEGIANFPAPPSDDGYPDEEEMEQVPPIKPSGESNSMQKTLTSRKSSMLAVSDDPFAPREGKTLLWRNVSMTLVRTR